MEYFRRSKAHHSKNSSHPARKYIVMLLVLKFLMLAGVFLLWLMTGEMKVLHILDFLLKHSSPRTPVETNNVSAAMGSIADTQYPAEGGNVLHPAEVVAACNESTSLFELAKAASLRGQGSEKDSVVVAGLTEGWHEMVDFFLHRLERGNGTARLRQHLLVINLDRESFDFCCSIRPRLHCYFEKQEDEVEKVDFNGYEKSFMTPTYLRLVWHKLKVHVRILELGFDILFTDLDIVWFQDPFPLLLAEDSGNDMLLSCDFFFHAPALAQANTGFYFVRSNPRSIAFFHYWFKDHDQRFPGMHDQDAFMEARPQQDSFTRQSIGLRVGYLSTEQFSGLCEHPLDVTSVATVHANCCIGLENKLEVLRKVAQVWDDAKGGAAVNEEAKNNKTKWECAVPL